MKFFQNKKAMTLAELVVGVTISSAILIIVMFFLSSSIENLRQTNVLTKNVDISFTFKDKINRFIQGGYQNFTVFGDNGENSVILLENDFLSEGVLFGIVNNDTKKIQKEKKYGDNFIGYRKISQTELGNIQTNSGVIYNYTFFGDKIYHDMRIKDFDAELYNFESILDLYISVILLEDENNFGKLFSEIFFDKIDIYEFNLNF